MNHTRFGKCLRGLSIWLAIVAAFGVTTFAGDFESLRLDNSEDKQPTNQ